LQQDPRLKVDVLNNLKDFSKTDLKPFGAVVIHFKNINPDVPGRMALETLREYVHDGGGLVLVHFACGAFQEFKQDYEEMVGRVWMGLKHPPGRRQHDPRGPFEVTITDPQHPVTKGLRGFGTNDELYTCLEGDARITTLISAKSTVDGRTYPMAMLHQYGSGRVFNPIFRNLESSRESVLRISPGLPGFVNGKLHMVRKSNRRRRCRFWGAGGH
jgi:type 1 glutamine amidotransferase